jgi:hypothetical protein
MKYRILRPVGLVRKVIENSRFVRNRNINLLRLTKEEVDDQFDQFDRFSAALRSMRPRYNEHWNKEE